jgi:hypothetical protein
VEKRSNYTLTVIPSRIYEKGLTLHEVSGQSFLDLRGLVRVLSPARDDTSRVDQGELFLLADT